MHFLPGHRGIEDADGQNVRFRPHDMLVMLVERIHHAGRELVGGAGAQILDRAGALEHEHGLQMVLVMHVEFLAGIHGGDMEREAHAIILEQQAGAFPAIGLHIILGFADALKLANDHAVSPYPFMLRRRRRAQSGRREYSVQEYRARPRARRRQWSAERGF